VRAENREIPATVTSCRANIDNGSGFATNVVHVRFVARKVVRTGARAPPHVARKKPTSPDVEKQRDNAFENRRFFFFIRYTLERPSPLFYERTYSFSLAREFPRPLSDDGHDERRRRRRRRRQ